MGIVKISDQMHENLRLASGALSRSINAQAEHWLRIGLLAETNPDLRYSELCQLLLRGNANAPFKLGTLEPVSEGAPDA